MNFGMSQDVKNAPFWNLEQNKNEFLFGNGEKAVLMFQMYLRVYHLLATADIENRTWIFITFFSIFSFTGHIQRF